MSRRKRSREEVEAQNKGSQKKIRKDEEGNLQKFFSLVATEDTLIAGLTYFLTTTKQGDLELLKTYLESQADCQHLLAPLEWERERRSQDVVLLCFQCLEQVLLFTASPGDNITNQSLYVSLGTSLVHVILNDHMRCMYSSLVTTVPMRLVACCLRLLTAMVAQGPNAAREVQRMFNFGYKPLEVFPTRTNVIQGLSESVRMCFLKFAMSFLVIGDHSTVSEILQHRGFLSSFFKFLPQDSMETIQLFLSTLLQQVVLDPKVSKKAKSIFFNQYVLKQIAQLLTQANNKDDEPMEGVSSVRMLVFELLSTLCSDFQLGVCYKSKEPPDGLKRTNNPVLLHLLLSFTPFLDDPLVQELIIKTLSTCPDIVISYLKSLNFNFEPLSSPKWTSGMEFWIKLYMALPDLPSVMIQSSTVQPPSSHVDVAVGLTLPLPSVRHAFSLGLQHTLPLVKYQTLLLMEAVLSRAEAIVECWGPVCKSLNSLDSFLVRYCDSVLKSLPDIRTLVSLRQQILTGFDMSKMKSSPDTLLPAHHVKNCELLECPSLFLSLILKVMRGYQRLSPLIFMQADFNVFKLLPTFESLSNSPDDVVTTLQIFTEAIAAGQDWRHLSVAVFSLILQLTMSEHEDVAREAHGLILKLMDQSPCWSGNHKEMDILLSCVISHHCASPDNKQTLLEFVSNVLLDTSTIPLFNSFAQPASEGDDGHQIEEDQFRKLSLEEVLSEPLPTILPDYATHDETVCEEHKKRNFPLATHFLKALVSNSAASVVIFVGEVMAKLLLAQPTATMFKSFASLVVQHLECDQLKEEYLSSEWKDTYLELLKYFSHWSLSSKASTILAETKKSKRMSVSSLLKKYGSKADAVYPLKEQDPLVTRWLLASPSTWDMSDLSLKELISIVVTHSCKELDSVMYLYLKKHIAICPGWTSQKTAQDTQQDTISCQAKNMVMLTEKLTSSATFSSTRNEKSATIPWWYEAEVKTLPVDGGGLRQDPTLDVQLKTITSNLKRNYSSNKHTVRLFESPLFRYFAEEDKTYHGSFCMPCDVMDHLLSYVLTSVTPVCVNIAKLLIESSQVVRDTIESSHLPVLCQRIHSSCEEEELVGLLQVVSKLLEAFVSGNAHNGTITIPSSNHKKSVKYLHKNSLNLCLANMALDNSYSLQVASSQVVKHLCALSRKGFRSLKKAVDQWLLAKELTRVQLALCCEVACNESDYQFSSVVVKQGVMVLSQLFNESVTSEENAIVKFMIEIIKKMNEPLALELYPKQWNEFVHYTLRHRFTVDLTLKLLSHLIVVVYSRGQLKSSAVVPISLDTVYEMVWSHSEFLCTINSSELTSKGSLVQLMVQIVELMPSVCDSTHVGVLLSSYFASRSCSDRGILYLLHLYEISGVAVGNHRPFLWGPTAVEHYKLKQETGNWLLWKQPGFRDVIECFDKKLLKLSTENFPLDIMLKPANPFLETSADTKCNQTDIYDPCFLLPLMSHVLDTSCVVDCRQFVDHGCLSYLIMSLCSHHEDVRYAGGHTLTRYLVHLQGSKFKEKAEVYFLLKVLRNSLNEGDRLCCSYGAFLATSLLLLLHPENQLYSIVAHFIVYKPAFILNDLPLYNIMLWSSSTEHFHERSWMLKVLANGLRSEEDILLYIRRDIFAQVTALYNAAILDRSSTVSCCELFVRASNIYVNKAASVINSAFTLLLM